MAEELISVDQALNRLLSKFKPVGTEKIEINDAYGRILAESVYADFDLPAFDNSSMDGFAVIHTDTAQASLENPTLLRIIEDIPAGKSPKKTIETGQAARIMTGAAVPPGATAVVPVELTDLFTSVFHKQTLPKFVRVHSAVKHGENIRFSGTDVNKGELVLSPGKIRPQELGMLTTLGIKEVPVFRIPKVGILSCGDELISPGQKLQPGKIYDSNSNMLSGLVSRAGAEVACVQVVGDDETLIIRAFDKAIFEYGVDLLISTAGVSVGAYDFVKAAVQAHGKIDFWRVNMRPGKPIAFGEYRGKPLIGLPGNPVSAFIGFEVFIRPAIWRCAGRGELKRARQGVSLGEPVASDGRESYLRAIVVEENGQEIARLTGHQGSGNLRSLVQANALIIIPSGVKSLPTGAMVDAWLFDDIGS